MIARLRDLTLNRDGTQNITITVQNDFRPVIENNTIVLTKLCERLGTVELETKNEDDSK